MVSRMQRKEGAPAVSKLVLYGNHTLRVEMDTCSCEINARLINRPHIAHAAPRTPRFNVGLFCGAPPASKTGVYFAPLRSWLHGQTRNIESEGRRGGALPVHH